MQIEERKQDDVLVVTLLENRLDATAAAPFKEEIVGIINRGENNIVLNLSKVEFIDSSGLGAIVSALKNVDKNGDLVITGTCEAVMILFKLTRMDKIFRIFETEEEAILELA